MDTAISRQLVDKIYEKRKAAALELEKQIRECHQQGEQKRIGQIIDQLVEMFSTSSNPLHIRNGGLIGLAGTAIALGVDIAPYMDRFIDPLLKCFIDPENRIRYFSAECLYNIAKVSKGEVLVYFNDIFDALSKLYADTEVSVKNGAELLDRLLRDIVSEYASVYVPMYAETAAQANQDPNVEQKGVLIDLTINGEEGPRKAFSLARFIPLLRERMDVLNPFTRSFLVEWIRILASAPELELITYLPEFLDGLMTYLSDPDQQVKSDTEDALDGFLHEIKLVADRARQDRRSAPIDYFQQRHDHDIAREGYLGNGRPDADSASELDDSDPGILLPGQGVKIDFPAIIEILIAQLDADHEEVKQSTALKWLSELLSVAPEVMVSFTPRLIAVILPNLSHHAPSIQNYAIQTNKQLFNVIQNLPTQRDGTTSPDIVARGPAERGPTARFPRSPTPTMSATGRQSSLSNQIARDTSSPDLSDNSQANLQRSRSGTTVDPTTMPRQSHLAEVANSANLADAGRSHSPAASLSSVQRESNAAGSETHTQEEPHEPFDYQLAVYELTGLLDSQFVETRISGLKWLTMLHQKVPTKILRFGDDITFFALLKILSDPSEEVIKYDLQLLSQMSSSSEEWFNLFTSKLLELFGTDAALFQNRGSLIIRLLCINLSTEKVYKTFAELLEKEEDLKDARTVVQKLNVILITSPELADFRRRLKNVETRQDGQALFITLYRSWCHDPVSIFSLCLLAQAYEHASNLLYIFAELEITVDMLVQIDKLVQLIESPVFTYLRLQLLEPEKYPYLFKCLYGLLMLLPQSSAFVSLRNRLNAVNSAGYLQVSPKITVGVTGRSKMSRDEIKWQELLQHFRQVQARHERSKRATGFESTSLSNFPELDKTEVYNEKSSKPSAKVPPMRRRVTGDVSTTATPAGRSGALSPLNPKARGPGGLPVNLTPPGIAQAGLVTNNLNAAASLTQAQKARRPADLSRK